MLSLVLELFVSVVLCGVLVFFAFLNAPAEAGLIAEEEAAAAATADSGYEPALLPSSELPLFTLLSRCVSLHEDTPCGIAYRWLLMSALHYSAREVYSEAHLREWDSGVGDLDEEEGGHSGADGDAACGHTSARSTYNASPSLQQQQQQQATMRGSATGAGTAASRRSRRRPRRGGAPLLTSPPTPLRRESAYWVNVALRWAAFLCLGGGTVRPEVWTDHLLFHTEKVLNAVNSGYAEQMRARAMLVRLLGNQLSGAGGPPRPLAPQQLLSNAAASHLSAPRPLVRVQHMELGAGLLGGPARELRRAPPMGTSPGVGGDAAAAMPATLPPALSATVSRGNVLTSPTLGHVAAPVTAGVMGGGGGAPSTPGGGGGVASPSPLHTPPPAHNSAIAAAGVLLTSSVAGLGSVLADVVSSVTTGNHHGSSAGGGGGGGTSGGDGAVLGGSVAGSMAGGDYGGGTSGGGGVGAQLGIVLPRIEGDVISVEEPFTTTTTAPTTSGVGGEGNTAVTRGTDGAATAASLPPPPAASSPPPSAPVPPALPLRCFAVPLYYSDQRFHLRLGCCLPLGALLPVALCVPPDVLTLDCAVAVRRVIFSGHLHAALHGARVELSFPVAPQFTAVVAATPDYGGSGSGGLRDAHGNGHASPSHPSAMYGGGHVPYPYPQQQQSYVQSSLSPAGATVEAARTLGHTFTAVNTTRNEATAVRESGYGQMGREVSPSVRPPMQQQQQQHQQQHYATMSMAASNTSSAATASTTTGTSSINERNEKVQEVVLLAVRRLILSLTYPNVLAGRLVCVPAAAGGSANGAAAAAHTLSMKWQRTTATLPLRM